MAAGISVSLPAVLAQMTGGERTVVVGGETIGDALASLARERPALSAHLFDDAGAVRLHVVCFRNDEYVHGAEGLLRRVHPGDSITLLSSVSGG